MSDENGEYKPKRDELGRIMKGYSGNPKGRPKRMTLTELVHKKLDDNEKGWEAVVALVIEKLLKDKDTQVLKTFWEYTDGKPKQSLDVTTNEDELKKLKDYIDEQVQDTDKDTS